MEAMDFARAHGLTEDALSTLLTTSSADSRAVRTWGFQDRLRRTAPPGTAPAPVVMKKDLSSFVTAAGRAGLVLPIGAVAAETITSRIAQRDTYLDALGSSEATARCPQCGLELIPPFRSAGVHPECA
jgi:3-hydroxyisobutyrate dehydrogenase-like beta-hydroxyacid dehydrogenase